MANQFSAIIQAIVDSLSDTKYGLTRLSQSEAAMTIIVISAGCLLVYFAIKTVQHVLFLIRLSTICIVLVMSIGIGVTLWFKLSISLMPSVYKTGAEPHMIDEGETVIMLSPPDPVAVLSNTDIQLHPPPTAKPHVSETKIFHVSESSASPIAPKSKPEGKKISSAQTPARRDPPLAQRKPGKPATGTQRRPSKAPAASAPLDPPITTSRFQRAIDFYYNFQTQRDLLYPLISLVWSSKDDKE